MNPSLLWTIIGVVATILFGIGGIWIVKQYKYPGDILCVFEDVVGLVERVVDKFSNLDIKYNGNAVSPDLYWFRFLVINTGHIDLESKGASGLKMDLPEGCNWLEAKVTRSSPEVSAIVLYENNLAHVEWDMLKCNEFIEVDSLLHIPTSADNEVHAASRGSLLRALHMHHRIANTSKASILLSMPDPPVRGLRAWTGTEWSLLRVLLIAFMVFAAVAASVTQWHLVAVQSSSAITGQALGSPPIRTESVRYVVNYWTLAGGLLVCLLINLFLNLLLNSIYGSWGRRIYRSIGYWTT